MEVKKELPCVIKTFDYQLFGANSGIGLLGAVSGDPQFQYAELPPGWKKILERAAVITLWKVLDCQGRERAIISAWCVDGEFVNRLRPLSRFQVSYLYMEGLIVGCVRDGGKLIYTTASTVFPAPTEDNVAKALVKLEVADIANEWLDKNYPDWRHPGAYWD